MVCSELLFLKGVAEVEEGGSIILLFLLVAESESALHVVALASEDLELVELGDDELNELGGALLEFGNAVSLALLLEVLSDGLEETLNPGHEVLLGEGDFVELEGINNVDDGLGVVIILYDVVGGNTDLVGSLFGVRGLDFHACVVEKPLLGVGIGAELVARDDVLVNSHVDFSSVFVSVLMFEMIKLSRKRIIKL